MRLLHDLVEDSRYAVRQLARARFFTLTATASISIGILVAVSAFTLLNAILFKRLPVPDPEGIYHVYTSGMEGDSRYGRSSWPDYLEFTRSDAFAGLAAHMWDRVPVTVPGENAVLDYVAFVSPNYFQVLRLPLAYGRHPNPDVQEEVVLSYGFWRRAFGSDPGVLGTTMKLGAATLTIVGVAPESYVGTGMGPPLVGWVNTELLDATGSDMRNSRRSRGFEIIGRLADGSTPAIAAAQLSSIAKGLAEQYPEEWSTMRGNSRTVALLTHRESLAPPGARGELIFGLIAGTLLVLFVLLLACTNVAALLLGRAVGRQHEVAVRLALGANRPRLIRQMLTESLLLALAGAVISLVFVAWAGAFVRARGYADMFDLRLDWRVILVAIGTSALCAIIFGLAPARQSLSPDMRSALGGGSGSKSRNRLRGGLIAAQVAVSCVLILLAASAVRGVRAFVRTDPGVPLAGLVSIRGNMDMFGEDTLRNRMYREQVAEIARGVPGVHSVARTMMYPLGRAYISRLVVLPDGRETDVETNTVGSAYFEAMALAPIQGRVFTRSDRADADIAVVSESFLRTHKAAIGQLVTLRSALPRALRIVGTVPDIRYHSDSQAQRPVLYVIDEDPQSFMGPSYVVRTSPGDERRVARSIAAAVHARYPELVIPAVESLRDRVAADTKPQAIMGRVALGVGAVELALSAVGLYGLLMFALFARRREVGVRMALGSSPRRASWDVVRHGLQYAGAGAVVGALLCIPATIFAAKALPGVTVTDPVPVALAISAILAAVASAALIPARQAAAVDPMEALRNE